jgi:hypothetical protein
MINILALKRIVEGINSRLKQEFYDRMNDDDGSVPEDKYPTVKQRDLVSFKGCIHIHTTQLN